MVPAGECDGICPRLRRAGNRLPSGTKRMVGSDEEVGSLYGRRYSAGDGAAWMAASMDYTCSNRGHISVRPLAAGRAQSPPRRPTRQVSWLVGSVENSQLP